MAEEYAKMIVNQVSPVLNALVQQMTGQATIDPINTSNFVSVATTMLKTGYDPVLNQLTQMWGRTIFSSRDYRAPLNALRMELSRWGNATRKITPLARDMVNDDRFTNPISAGSSVGSVDMYQINKQEVLQTNIYGEHVYQQAFTIFRDQFDTAFTSAEEFAQFNAMLMTERQNDRESYRESIARGLQANFIGAIINEAQDGRVVHLLTEYKDQTGLTDLTAQSVYTPENFAPFMRWVYARVKTLSRMMAERSQMFQTNISGKKILRHTPADRLRVALFAPAMDQMESMVMSDTYHDNYLRYATFEPVNYWQSIETPDSISVNASYTAANGSAAMAENVEQAGIFGIMHDADAIGYAIVNDWNALTPFNARGGYWNEFYHSTFRTIQDMTEKAVVLLLD